MIEITKLKNNTKNQPNPAVEPAPVKPSPAKPEPKPAEPVPDSPRPPQPQRRPLTNPTPMPDRTCPTICPIRPRRNELTELVLPDVKNL